MTDTTAHINELKLTDEQLNYLNTLVRQSKVEMSSEEAVLVALGRKDMPMSMRITLVVGSLWEERMRELNGASVPPSEVAEDASEVVPPETKSPKAKK